MLESALLLAVLLLGYLFRHRWLPNKQHKTTRQKVGTPAVSPFHAVSIECLKIPCNAASTLANKRFLPQDASSLPLRHVIIPTASVDIFTMKTAAPMTVTVA
ncbi:hypothetical protein KHX94_04815 [Shewanella dokdonensis]|uniref:Secreted protein n=1 Tax=Shewanella dokdonensis TaxID=712036 RepID=A0ABX8DHL1_9GAMM|nr:hypothetical protein [Shewanella dokdonensis]QVK23964.1 hypothetical protein KHX94_04815 [Shewanella dokdonensis]